MGNTILYANVFIAICASAFVLEGYYLLHEELKFDVVALLGGVATLFTYMLIRLAAINRIREYEPDVRWDFFLKYINLMKGITILAGIGCIILFFLVPPKVQLTLLIPAFISIAYGIPVKIGIKKFRLRDIGIAKIFLISLVWAYTGSIMPAANTDLEIFSLPVIFIFFANFFFIFSLTLPFDIKDMEIDSLNNVNTIPKLIGISKTYKLAYLSLIMSALLHWLIQKYIIGSGNDLMIPLFISLILTGVMIQISKYKKNTLMYFGGLDGMIVLQFLLILIID